MAFAFIYYIDSECPPSKPVVKNTETNTFSQKDIKSDIWYQIVTGPACNIPDIWGIVQLYNFSHLFFICFPYEI